MLIYADLGLSGLSDYGAQNCLENLNKCEGMHAMAQFKVIVYLLMSLLCELVTFVGRVFDR